MTDPVVDRIVKQKYGEATEPEEAETILRDLAAITPPTPRNYDQQGPESFAPWVRDLIEVQNRARAVLRRKDDDG